MNVMVFRSFYTERHACAADHGCPSVAGGVRSVIGRAPPFAVPSAGKAGSAEPARLSRQRGNPRAMCYRPEGDDVVSVGESAELPPRTGFRRRSSSMLDARPAVWHEALRLGGARINV